MGDTEKVKSVEVKRNECISFTDGSEVWSTRLYTTSYNKPQGQQFDTAVLSFIKLQ